MTAVGLTVCLTVACCSYPQLMYPVARAFGSPLESELVQCRDAFRQLQVSSSAPIDFNRYPPAMFLRVESLIKI